jgi:hypothetical protein
MEEKCTSPDPQKVIGNFFMAATRMATPFENI